MKKYNYNILLVFLLFYLGISKSNAQLKFYFKPSISYSSIQPQDLNNTINSANFIHSQIKSTIPIYYYEGKFDKFGNGIDFGGEVVFLLNNTLGIGAGFTMIERVQKSTVLIDYYGSYSEKLNQKISTLPIYLNIYYYFLKPSINFVKINTYLTGGLDFHFSTYDFSYGTIAGTNTEITEGAVNGTANHNGLGFHFGIGGDIPLLSKILLNFEASYMFYRPSDWNGDKTTIQQDPYSLISIAGPLVYYQEYWEDELINKLDIMYTVPSNDENYVNPRKAKIDFSHFSIKMGIILTF